MPDQRLPNMLMGPPSFSPSINAKRLDVTGVPRSGATDSETSSKQQYVQKALQCTVRCFVLRVSSTTAKSLILEASMRASVPDDD